MIDASRELLAPTGPLFGEGSRKIKASREETVMHIRPQSDPIASMRTRLAALDARIVHLREMQREGDGLAGRLAEHVERERGQISEKLKATS